MAAATTLEDDREYVICRRYPLSSKFGLGRSGIGGVVIGLALGSHLLLFVESLVFGWSLSLVAWSLYVIFLAAFHLLEFLSTALYKFEDLSYDSYLLNHSTAYTCAVFAAALEFWLESLFLFRPPLYLICIGSAITILGQGLRFLAMRTAGRHFAHRIMTRRAPGHELVTHGVYAIFRHPAYTAWFYWSIATQIILANPICCLAFGLAAFNFFNDRIPYEEHTLATFYPDTYPAYARNTIIAIPFIAATTF